MGDQIRVVDGRLQIDIVEIFEEVAGAASEAAEVVDIGILVNSDFKNR